MVEFVQFPQSSLLESDRHNSLAGGEEQAMETDRQRDRETERQTERDATASRTATAALMPTLRALDETGAKIECFLPPRVHIDGW
eukprot:COSAG03_NODE_812_length_5759_cov_19.856007_2_plen_85_part_00